MTQKIKIDNEPIDGLHGVTARLDTYQTNIDFEEGKIELNRGYARLFDHPFVRELQTQMAAKFNAPKALVFTSVQAGVFVLIDALFGKDLQGISINNPLAEEIIKFLEDTSGLKIPRKNGDSAEIVIENISDNPVKHPANKYLIGFAAKDSEKSQGSHSVYDAMITSIAKDDTGFLIFNNQELGDEIELLLRNAGFNLNSRKAERLLNKLPEPDPFNFSDLKFKLAILEKGKAENVFLFPTGMGAIAGAIFPLLTPERTKIVMPGSPYVDTRRILEKLPARRGTPESVFLKVDDIESMQQAIDETTALVICETPTNPLIRFPDLEKVIEIAHRHGALVLVDNTVASPFNLNPFDYDADMIAHSTTKSLNGMNDHIGGALLVKDDFIAKKISDFKKLVNIKMDSADAAILNRNLDTFNSRMKRMNKNAMKIAQYLENHPKVKKVYYPGLASHPDHEVAKRYMKGFSTLLSFLLAGDPEKNTRAFYDSIDAPIAKGPSLGASQSLLFLYVIMAHYTDSPEKLTEMGLDKYLLRLSVGTENVDELIWVLDKAFEDVV